MGRSWVGTEPEAAAGRTQAKAANHLGPPAPRVWLPHAMTWSALWRHTLQPGLRSHPWVWGGLGPGKRGCPLRTTIISGGLAGLPLHLGVSFLRGSSA